MSFSTSEILNWIISLGERSYEISILKDIQNLTEECPEQLDLCWPFSEQDFDQMTYNDSSNLNNSVILWVFDLKAVTPVLESVLK